MELIESKDTVSHNVHKFTLDVTYVQKGVQLVTKV